MSKKAETEWERRKRLAAVFGDALPDITSDERDPAEACRRRRARQRALAEITGAASPRVRRHLLLSTDERSGAGGQRVADLREQVDLGRAGGSSAGKNFSFALV